MTNKKDWLTPEEIIEIIEWSGYYMVESGTEEDEPRVKCIIKKLAKIAELKVELEDCEAKLKMREDLHKKDLGDDYKTIQKQELLHSEKSVPVSESVSDESLSGISGSQVNTCLSEKCERFGKCKSCRTNKVYTEEELNEMWGSINK